MKLFLLVRGEQSLLYFPGQGGAFSYAKDYPAFPSSMHADHGKPLQSAPALGAGPGWSFSHRALQRSRPESFLCVFLKKHIVLCAGGPLSVFTREWSGATVTLDCSSFEVSVTPKNTLLEKNSDHGTAL